MRACWLKWVGRDWSISADYIWLNYSDANTVFRTLEKVYQNARKVDRFIEELEKRYHVDYVPHDYLADEPDNRNL